ncbi:MAG: hypothetical protein QOE28_104 [Solirubrobacteraceae bacterium]|nr:hypothetical protein [Solirubrobacteraceae bacterium]
MNPQAAGELVRAWVDSHEDPAAVARQGGPVSRAVRELAPDADRMGIGQSPTGPVMAVLLESAMLVFQSKPHAAASEAATPVRARLLALDPVTCELEVTERFEERAGGQSVRVHSWQLRTPAVELTFDGRQTLQGGLEGGADANEDLGRAVAAKLGWTLP